MITDSADHEVLFPLFGPSGLENGSSKPGKENGTQYDHQINGDNSIQGDSKHNSPAV
ncbi:MAG: hypothetical protein P1V20_14545 [Verrucomicrobiales bacterium]|nr:hypothetical protein [Verrucomicrobiales bacterium]